MILHEWARRHAADPNGPRAVERLLAGASDEEVAHATGLPRAAVAGVRSYYDLLEPGPRVCDGTACHFAGAASLAAGGDLAGGGGAASWRAGHGALRHSG